MSWNTGRFKPQRSKHLILNSRPNVASYARAGSRNRSRTFLIPKANGFFLGTMKILITNTVSSNGGDAAILLGTITNLYEAFGEAAEIVVFDGNPEALRPLYPEIDFRQRLYATAVRRTSRLLPRRAYLQLSLCRMLVGAWCLSRSQRRLAKLLLSGEELRDLNTYAEAALVVSTGGTYLVENYSLVPAIFDYSVTALLDKPLVFFTQSLGPFRRPSNRRRLRQIFNRALLILVRDSASHQHLLDIGVENPNIYIRSDAAFALDCGTDDAAPPNPVQKIPGVVRVAISVRAWHHFKTTSIAEGTNQYRYSIAAAVSHLVRNHNATVRFVSTCQGIEGYWTDDSLEAGEIVKLLPADVCTAVKVEEGFHRPEELVAMFREHDLVVSTRMHGAILALLARTPVVAVSYEFKTQELFARLGLEAWVENIESVTAATLISRVDALLQERQVAMQQLGEAVTREIENAIATSSLLRWALAKTPGAGLTREPQAVGIRDCEKSII